MRETGAQAHRLGEHDGQGMTRRTLLARAAALGVTASTLSALDLLAFAPARAQAKQAGLPEIQFEIEKYIAPAIKVEGVRVRFAPVYTTFATFTLSRTPAQADQAALAGALARIEASYPFSPSGVFVTIAYGVPYFERLPGGMAGALVSGHMPRLVSEPELYALEEAVPGPTDVSAANPGITKERFNVPVQIESNDMLVTLRSDSTEVIDDVLAWLAGESSTLAGQNVGELGTRRTAERHLTATDVHADRPARKVAEEQSLPYAETINTESPMWMGFSSQQVGTSGKAPITTFLGDGAAKLTTARRATTSTAARSSTSRT